MFPAGYRQVEGLAAKDFSWRTGEFEPDRSSGPHVNPKRQKRTTCLFEFDEVCDRVTNPDCLVVRSNQM
jgi:hypothetical protein